ncbi:MtrB/PioB family decaheme-associated outer membrane protein [Caenimonas koreensis DSM 17982]|uniref:MtrB/PioB family decaheme-associated outer membrane protein n=1 Tax=Caenimonas koreensis DSM 17982 TaxID=1121255 RepID=A0A844BBN7_9BURK|nr:MtrB/PioB family decaheme-associated outer membrane protein [Caenimonas koreensis]MRD47921.1 MtrB/PioB family decaheme-associated outer membrane protein [Caenimonas koreensis DSM 17982]
MIPRPRPPLSFSLSLLALSIVSGFGPAHAQSVAEGSITIGASVIDGSRADRTVVDQYTGLRPGTSAFGALSGDYWRADESKGTSVDFRASDLFGGNRELGLRWKKQGDWKVSAEYREQVRRESALATTASGQELDFKLKRTGLGLELSKVLGEHWQVDASVQSEKKEGSRLWGIGMNCPSPNAPGCRGTTGTEVGWAVLLLPEPVHATHTQLQARVSYAADRLSVSGGYYGSIYRNDYGSLAPTVPAALRNALGNPLPLSAGFAGVLGQPVALSPDNQAWQLDLTGSYRFTDTTRMNFKLARSQATQHQSFADAGLTGAPAGVTDLGGKVTTTLAQLGLTARPAPKLSMSATLHYENKDDQTPLALYNVEGTSAYTNRRLPRTDMRARVQGTYQFNSDWRGTLAATYESIDRGVFTPTSAVAGITALRQKTEETGLRAEVRRRMTDDLSGAISVESSRRGGSAWLRDNSGTGVTEVTDAAAQGVGYTSGIFMPTLADRKRDKIKFQADWQASESVALQLSAETGRDSYSSPSRYGVSRSALESVNVDATWAVNDKWNITAFASAGRQGLDQSRPDSAIMAFDNRSTTLGLGFTGKPRSGLEVGGTLSYAHDRSIYAQTLDATAGGESVALLAATGGLPDIIFRQQVVKLFGKYTLDKQSLVRLDIALARTSWNDWAWGYSGTAFTYSDGTTVSRKHVQNVSALGLSYIRRWP